MSDDNLTQHLSNLTGLEIAVIGMSGRFPGADNIDEFWENLKNGREGVTFFDENELKETGLDEKAINSNHSVNAYGILDKNLYFDAAFFGYTPSEAEVMDPQIRLLHECAYEALENAGYEPTTFLKPIGLFVGASANLPWQSFLDYNNISIWFATKQLTDKDFLATRIAYKLNLKGPAITIDTACSTSLTAIHLAVQSLISGDCDMSLAGGVTALKYTKFGYIYEEGMILSSDGHTRTFDVKSNGSNVGDGLGMVLLKRYSDALEDKDIIHAIIKGSAINNDGSRKAAYTAPSVEGQASVINIAHQMAEVEPESITYVEAHGTGTSLGDPVEIEALKAAFNTSKKHFCRIGSVKSNVGHLEMAAGVAGFIKTVLALEHKLIPPSLLYETPNPKIDFNDSPFIVNTQLTDWKRLNPHIPRRAGVSSFGIGGTNVHVVLEEVQTEIIGKYRGNKDEQAEKSRQLILLSAKTNTALNKMSENLTNFLRKHPDINLADTAYTLQIGRQKFPFRRMVVSSNNPQELVELLSKNSAKVKTYESTEDFLPIIFMYPGLGSQYVNMGLDIYEQEPIFREEMDGCFKILDSLLNYNIKEILYPQNISSNINKSALSSPQHSNDTIMDINQPEISQIVTFILEYALSKLLIQWGIKPSVMIGYSFGEYTAACISGIFSLENALKLILARGRLLQNTKQGAMLSVPLTEAEIEPFLFQNKDVSLAINNGTSCIVGGTPLAIDQFAQQMREKKLMCMRVSTERAIHSHLMESILEEFSQLFDSITFGNLQIPYISNITGDTQTDQEATNPRYWVRHLRETVQFTRGIKTLIKNPGAIFIEIGAGHDLSALVRRHLEDKGIDPQDRILNLVRTPQQQISDYYFLLNRIGRLWMYGQPIEWNAFWGKKLEQRRRVSLPTYPFESQFYVSHQLLSRKNQQPPIGTVDFSDWFYIPSWKRSPINAQQLVDIPKGTYWLIFTNGTQLEERIIQQLTNAEYIILTVSKGETFQQKNSTQFTINHKKPVDYDLLFKELKSKDIVPALIIHFWGITGMDSNPDISSREQFTPPENQETLNALELGFYSIQYLVRAIGKLNIKKPMNLNIVTNQVQEVIGQDGIYPEMATVFGALRNIPSEYIFITCRSIDIPQKNNPPDQLVEQLITELKSKPNDHTVAYRRNYRWVKYVEPMRFEKSKNNNPRLKSSGVYLITGGLGGIGLLIAQYIAKIGKPVTLILTGRSKFPHKSKWDYILKDPNHEENIKEKIKAIQELEKCGANVCVFSANIADKTRMMEAITEVEKNIGLINGIFHCAGLPDGEMIQRRDPSTSDSILEPKVTGTLVLYDLFKEHQLDFMVLCSSVVSILPQFGQVGYAAANYFLDAFAQWCTNVPSIKKNWGPTIAINWDRWQSIGTARIAEKKHKERSGTDLTDGIPSDKGIEALRRIMSDSLPQVIVSPKTEFDKEAKSDKIPPQTDFIKKLETSSIPKKFMKRPNLDNEYFPPQDETEQNLTNIWQNFFGIEPIGIEDDFFELGGDSLKGMGLMAKIHKKMQVEIPINDFFTHPTIKKLSIYIRNAKVSTYSTINPVEKKEYYLTSSPQKRLYVLHQMEENSTRFNVPIAFSMKGNINKDLLENAFTLLIQRHESLRTSFTMLGDEPIQIIHPTVDFTIDHRKEETKLDTQDLEKSIKTFIRGFDLSQTPLMRIGLLKIAESNSILIMDIHHIISDGTSHEILHRDLLRFISGVEQIPLRIHYKDFSEWQTLSNKNSNIKKQEEYWMNRFKNSIPILNLPLDFPRPKVYTSCGSSIVFEIHRDITTKLNQMAIETETTLYIVLLSAYTILLAKYSRQEDIVVGSPVAGRRHADLEKIIGLFVNMLPMRNQPKGEKTFEEFLKEVKNNALDAFENQEFPFENLVWNLQLTEDSGRTPLFDAVFALLNKTAGPPTFQSESNKNKQENESSDMNIVNITPDKIHHELLLNIREEEGKLFSSLEYSTELFKESTAQKMIQHFIEILQQITENKKILIKNISISHDLIIADSGLIQEDQNDFEF